MDKKFIGKKVLILGLGLNEGGVGSARFFAKTGAKVRVTDIKTEKELQPSLEKLTEFSNIEYVLGEHRNEDIDWADIIIRNPSLKPGNPYREYAEKSGKKVELDIGIFLDFVNPEQIIGITGSKGKSTTASLLYAALSSVIPAKAGICINKNGSPIRSGMTDYRNVILAGNIGKSVLDTLEVVDKDTLIILELSSFQLEAFEEHKVSPNMAVITNIFPEHLNYYSSFEDYIDAKRIIAKYQTEKDYLFLNSEDQITNSKEFLDGLKGQIIKFSKILPEDFKPTLIGEHNKPNYAASLAVATKIKVPEEQALQAMNQFTGNEMRLQLIKKENGIKIYNDSTATNPNATIAALRALNSCILICGGMNKGLKYEELADTIDRRAKAVYFIEGDATEEIKRNIRHKNIYRSTYDDLELLLKDVKQEAKEGDVILFSPGATSFNFWQNEFDRGRKFNEVVEKIFKTL